ncbi:MAG: hypothetical protein ACXACD_15195 [Candidatus Thorarchaeota archaeon]|jgi:hypothetical protein
MGNEYYFDNQQGIDKKNPGIFILAGLLGGIIGLVGTLASTFIAFAILSLGPLPYIEVIALVSGTLGMTSTLAVILLILGVYGLSVKYKAPILIMVGALDGVVLILNETVRAYFASIGDISSLAMVGLGTFVVGGLASMIFGAMLLRLRDRSQQPSVFAALGLVELMWPVVYFLMALVYVGLSYYLSQGIAIIVGVLLVVMYYNEDRSPTILSDTHTSDWTQPSGVWE